VNAPFGKAEIEQILPHRDPFLLLDEVVELDPGSRVVARKTVTDEAITGQILAGDTEAFKRRRAEEDADE